jgi:hypothetical protein
LKTNLAHGGSFVITLAFRVVVVVLGLLCLKRLLLAGDSGSFFFFGATSLEFQNLKW